MKKTLHVANIETMIYTFRYHLLLALQEQGYEVHIAAKITRPAVVREFEALGIKVYDIPVSRGLNPWNAVRSIIKLRRIIKKGNYDIVHTNTPTGGMVGRMAAFLAGHNNIYHTTAGFYFHENMGKAKYWFYSSIERYLTSKTQIMFSPNQEDIDTSHKLGIQPKDRIVNCGPSGVDLSLYDLTTIDQCRAQLISQLDINKDCFIIGLVGRMVWEKGFKEFIDVLANLNESSNKIHAVFVGEGPHSDEIQAYARQKACENISFVGFSDQVSRYLMAFDLLLFPSYREGFPITTIEAMAAKTPVVSFDIRGSRESIVEGKTGFIVPFKDVEAMTSKVQYLYNNRDVLVKMGEAGRVRVESYFTKQHHIDNKLPYY